MKLIHTSSRTRSVPRPRLLALTDKQPALFIHLRRRTCSSCKGLNKTVNDLRRVLRDPQGLFLLSRTPGSFLPHKPFLLVTTTLTPVGWWRLSPGDVHHQLVNPDNAVQHVSACSPPQADSRSSANKNHGAREWFSNLSQKRNGIHTKYKGYYWNLDCAKRKHLNFYVQYKREIIQVQTVSWRTHRAAEHESARHEALFLTDSRCYLGVLLVDLGV